MRSLQRCLAIVSKRTRVVGYNAVARHLFYDQSPITVTNVYPAKTGCRMNIGMSRLRLSTRECRTVIQACAAGKNIIIIFSTRISRSIHVSYTRILNGVELAPSQASVMEATCIHDMYLWVTIGVLAGA